MIRLTFGAAAIATLLAGAALAQTPAVNPSSPTGRLAAAGGAGASTAAKVAPATGVNAKAPVNPSSAAAAPHLPTAGNAKSSGPDKAPIKCSDGTRSNSKTKPCATKKGVDTAVLAAEAQPGETSTGPAGKGPVTNALPSGTLKTQ